jgi:epsilon-lactone hydrolase
MAGSEIAAIRALLDAQPRPAQLGERRKRLDALFAPYLPASDVRVEAVDAGGVTGEWTWTPLAEAARVILYLHGGGYVSGSLASYRHMVAEAGRTARGRTLALAYRLAPEHPFPAALDDAVAGYRFLLTHGIDPRHIAIAGDSAGGGLTIATMIRLRDAGLLLPACAWCISPWVDLEGLGVSMATKARSDPLVQKAYLMELAAAYLDGVDPRSPLAAPIHAKLEDLPPLLLQVGSAETLLDDAVRLAGRAGAADVSVRLEIWPDMIHVWHLFYQQLEAGRRALSAAGEFVRSLLSAAGP